MPFNSAYLKAIVKCMSGTSVATVGIFRPRRLVPDKPFTRFRPGILLHDPLFQSRAHRRDSQFQHHVKLTDPLVLKHQQAM